MMLSLAYILTAWQTLQWALIALAGVLGSSLFGGLEAGIYRLNRVRLHLLSAQRNPAALHLERMLRRPHRLIGMLLICNNASDYLASLGVTVLLKGAELSDRQIVPVVALLLTPILLVFGEILPKDLFQNFTDKLTYPFARPLAWAQRLFWCIGALSLIDLMSELLAKIIGGSKLAALAPHPRRVVTQLIQEGVGTGLLSPYQSEMIDRVLHPTETHVRDAMIAWPAVQFVRETQPPQAVWALADRSPFSRFPLLDRTGKVLGVVHVFDVLLQNPATCPPLTELCKPMPRLDPQAALAHAMEQLRHAGSPIGLVAGKDDKPLGIITVKDLVEPVIGELEAW
ncbi:MAG: CNNM domain-containing protein [Phycisphaerales bacterium]